MSEKVRNKLKAIEGELSNKGRAGLLSGLFRLICKEDKLYPILPRLVDRYINSEIAKNIGPKTTATLSKEQSKIRNSITNDIISEDMSWKVFCKVMLDFLRARKITFYVEVEHENGKKTANGITIKRASDDEEEENLDERSK